MTSLNVLRFIWTSHIKCFSRIDFEVVSGNLNSSPEIQVVVQTDHGLNTQTPVPACPSRVHASRQPLVFFLLIWLWNDNDLTVSIQEIAWYSLTNIY